MTPYWILFIFFAFLALLTQPFNFKNGRLYLTNLENLYLLLFKWFCILFLVFFIGLRYEVGGDWLNYKEIYFDLAKANFLEALLYATDPLFGIFNWLAAKLYLADGSSFGPLNWRDNIVHGYLLVNVFSAFLFSIGLIKFCFSLPRPILAIVVAVPYLIIVVSMGYVRQGAALGLIMYGTTYLSDNNIRKFIFFILIAALIHKASLIMLPLSIFISTRNKFFLFLGISLLAVVSGIILLESYIERVYLNYIEAEYSSSGAIFRLGMLLPPSIIFLYYQNKFPISGTLSNFWKISSISSIVLFLMLFFTSFSTFIDRIALFFLPLQMVVFSYLPDLFHKKYSSFLELGIVFYCAIVLFVWLNFAANSWAWIPYENILFLEQSNISYATDSPKT